MAAMARTAVDDELVALRNEVVRLRGLLEALETSRNTDNSTSTSTAAFINNAASQRPHTRSQTETGGESSVTSMLQPKQDIPDNQPSPDNHSVNDHNNGLHSLLLLADSALPLSAFAFSSGLESYLSHHSHSSPTAVFQPGGRADPKLALFLPFLTQSLAAAARAGLPFVLAAHDRPADLQCWDDTCDAATLCPVARRQSVEQGKALLAVWLRGLCALTTTPTAAPAADGHAEGVTPGSALPSISASGSASTAATAAIQALRALDAALRQPRVAATSAKLGPSPPPLVHGHLAPLFGAVAAATNVSRRDTAYIFLLNHAKSVISAAVRAGVCGPFKQQAILASVELRHLLVQGVAQGVAVYEESGVAAAGQVSVLLDLWVGRHEILYSRVFNS